MAREKKSQKLGYVNLYVTFTCTCEPIITSVESFIISTDYNSKRKLPKFRCAVAEENWGRGYFCWN